MNSDKLKSDLKDLIGGILTNQPSQLTSDDDLFIADGATKGTEHGTAYSNSGLSSGGGGLASPLTEPDINARTFHANVQFTDSTGLLTFIVKPLASITFEDANGEEAVFELADPNPPEEP